MQTKNTILSQKDLALLENIVLRYGKIVSVDQIQAGIGQDDNASAVRKRIAQLAQTGWLIRLKRGLYLVLTDYTSLGAVDVSELLISHTLNVDSYVSFERALQHHGLFDQLLKRVDSVTTHFTKSYQVLQTKYTFAKIKPDLYFGFAPVTIHRQAVNIAEAEKALLDLLYFRTSAYAISLVLEKLGDYQEQLDFEKLKRYCTRYSVGMVRKMGFLLDQVGIDTADLFEQADVKQNSYNKLTADADHFNAKWRLYYDAQLIG